METKVDSNASDDVVGLNYNEQEPGVINKKRWCNWWPRTKRNFHKTNVTDADTDSYIGLNDYAILKQVNVITGTQYDPSSLTLITGVTKDDPSMMNSRSGDSKISSNLTPDKGHSNNLVTSSPLIEYPIHQR